MVFLFHVGRVAASGYCYISILIQCDPGAALILLVCCRPLSFTLSFLSLSFPRPEREKETERQREGGREGKKPQELQVCACHELCGWPILRKLIVKNAAKCLINTL